MANAVVLACGGFEGNPEMLAQIRGPLFEDKVIDFIMEMANTTEVAMTVEELQQAQAEDDKPAA